MTWPITRHEPSWRERIPLEDTKGERAMRRILERLGLPFHSQNQGDFTVGEIVIEVNGKYHETQTQRDHDAWKENELRKLGFRVLRFKEHEVLKHPDLVGEIVRAYHLVACTRHDEHQIVANQKETS